MAISSRVPAVTELLSGLFLRLCAKLYTSCPKASKWARKGCWLAAGNWLRGPKVKAEFSAVLSLARAYQSTVRLASSISGSAKSAACWGDNLVNKMRVS